LSQKAARALQAAGPMLQAAGPMLAEKLLGCFCFEAQLESHRP